MIIWPWVALFSTGFIIGGYLILLGIDCVVMACSDMDAGGCKNRNINGVKRNIFIG